MQIFFPIIDMTAIQPARLKEQASQLAAIYECPSLFIQRLHELLHLYGRHVFRTGKTRPASILPAYKVPQPVLRKIELELSPYLKINCQGSLALCDALWRENYYEFKMLAAKLIGQIPVDNPDLVLNRIHTWSLEVKETTINEALFKFGLEYLIKKDSNGIINRTSTWLYNPQLLDNIFGLRLILAIVELESFQNLPQVYRLITPFVRSAPTTLRSYIVEILEILIQRSPSETAYFLQQNIELSFDKDTAWFIRRCISKFPPDIQNNLRLTMRNVEKTHRIEY